MANPSTGFSETSEPNDSILLERVALGDAAALNSLLDRHWSALVSYSARLLGNWDAAQDVTQETFVRIWERREQWRSNGSVRALLYQIARNLVLDAQKRQDRRTNWIRDRYRDERRIATPLQELQRSELEEAFREALRALPERRREVFVLARVDGLSYREIGEVMGVAPQTVANQLSAALSTLREALQEFTHEPARSEIEAATRPVPTSG